VSSWEQIGNERQTKKREKGDRTARGVNLVRFCEGGDIKSRHRFIIPSFPSKSITLTCKSGQFSNSNELLNYLLDV